MYVPCPTHPLNIVGVHAIESYPEATIFFAIFHIYIISFLFKLIGGMV